MSRGLQRNQRALLVAQAALVWSSSESDELSTFIQTGQLGSDATEVLPYNPVLRDMVVKQFQGAL